ADRERIVTERINAGLPKQFVKEVSRKKSTLGGREATELVEEVNFAALMGGKTGPKGEKLPDKVIGVTRYCFDGNRAYVVGMSKPNSPPTPDEEKAFFENFEIVPITDGPSP